VGAVLGVSKQAAQQRFPAGGPLSSWPDGVAADVLTGLGVTREAILTRTHEIVGAGTPRRWEALGVSPRLKRALELARAGARRLGHRCVGTEHVLLGIARLDQGVAANLLRQLGAPPARILEEVATRLGIAAGELAPAASGETPTRPPLTEPR
jgi:ATP-dependent Clp protease ATP-binding subunit ClpC